MLKTQKTTTAFLNDTSNMFGELKPETRARLETVIANPSQETWDEAFTIIVNGETHMTLWQAWIAVDSDAPLRKPLKGPWPRVPDQLTLYRALKHATSAQRAIERPRG